MTDETTKSKKRTIHRSPAYPSINLERAIPLAQKLNEKFSDDAFSRDNAVIELGLQKGGTAFRKIAALAHFGLINRKGSSYSITSLAKQIIFPGDDEEIKQSAIKNAAKNPKLYKNLILSYQGKQLPTALHHRLITSENFNQSVAEEVAKDFKKSMEFAGILKNGIMIGSEDDIIPQSPEAEELATPSEEFRSPESGKVATEKPMLGAVSIPLGQDITVNFSANLFRALSDGKFKDALKTLEKLGEGEVNGTSKTDAPNAPVESN